MQLRLTCMSCNGTASHPFHALTQAQIGTLDQGKIVRRYRVGQVLYDEGASAEAIYCIHSGRVKLFKIGVNDDEIVIGLAGPGSIIGYLSCIDGEAHSASAVTLTEAVVCAIPLPAFSAVLLDDARNARSLLKQLACSLRKSQDALVFRTHVSAICRLAHLLMSFLEDENAECSGNPLPVPVKRLEIAQMIGATPETVSRALRILHEGGIVSLGRRQIIITNPTELARLAQLPAGR